MPVLPRTTHRPAGLQRALEISIERAVPLTILEDGRVD